MVKPKDDMGRARKVEPKERGVPDDVVGMRVSKEYREWVVGLMEEARLGQPELLDHALVAYAKAIGYTPKAPHRL